MADVTDSSISERSANAFGPDLSNAEENLCWAIIKDGDQNWRIEDGVVENEIGSSSILMLPGDFELVEPFSPPAKVREIKVKVENFQDGRFFSLVRSLTTKFGNRYIISIAGSFSSAQLNHLARLGVRRFEFESEKLASRGLTILETEANRIRYKEYFTHRRELE